jgi:hypothetical protein
MVKAGDAPSTTRNNMAGSARLGAEMEEQLELEVVRANIVDGIEKGALENGTAGLILPPSTKEILVIGARSGELRAGGDVHPAGGEGDAGAAR